MFLPLSRPDRAKKAAESGADWVGLDLEDGVAAADKHAARAALPEVCAGWPATGPFLAVRINAAPSPDAAADLEAIKKLPRPLNAVMIPKVEHPDSVTQTAEALKDSAPPIIALIETPAGVAAADAIAAASPPPLALIFGAADYLAHTGGTDDDHVLLFPRASVVNAAAAAGIPALDSPWLHLDDDEGLRQSAVNARQFGFAGKVAIHPRHVSAIAEAFTPQEVDIERARRIVAAADGAQLIDGMMVDAPIIMRARRTLAAAGKAIKK